MPDVDVLEETGDPEATACPDCDGAIVVDGAERICEDCGLVVDVDELDRGPEWMEFDGDVRGGTKRCNGSAHTIEQHDGGLGSQVGWGKGSASAPLDAERTERLQRENKRARGESNGGQYRRYGLGEVARITSALELPEAARQRACKLFREIHDAELLLGYSLDAGAAAAVLAASREMRLPTTLAELDEVARDDLRKVTQVYQDLTEYCDCQSLPPTPSELVPKLASDLGLEDALERHARELASAVEAEGLHSGCKPRGIAAACIYVASCGPGFQKRTQETVSEVADVSAVTIRNRQETVLEVSDCVGGL